MNPIEWAKEYLREMSSQEKEGKHKISVEFSRDSCRKERTAMLQRRISVSSESLSRFGDSQDLRKDS